MTIFKAFSINSSGPFIRLIVIHLIINFINNSFSMLKLLRVFLLTRRLY